MKTKKWLSVLILWSALTASIVGCGSGSEPKEIKTSDSQEESAKSGETGNGEISDSDTEISISEQLLLDQDGIKVTATEYVNDGFLGDGLKLLIENNSDKDYTLGCDALIVNDFMLSDLFSTTVAAGKKTNETLSMYSSELASAGIDTVGKVEIYFHAYDSEWKTLFQDVYTEVDTSAFDSMDTSVDASGTELYNSNGIRIVGKGVEEDSFLGKSIPLYIENTSGQNVTVSVDDLSVNGFMLEPLFSATVYDGKKTLRSITLLSSELETNGITSIEQVELKFKLLNSKTYQTIAESDVVAFTAE